MLRQNVQNPWPKIHHYTQGTAKNEVMVPKPRNLKSIPETIAEIKKEPQLRARVKNLNLDNSRPT